MSLHYEDAGLRLFHGSNKDILGADALGYPHSLGYHPDRLLPDASFDSIVTDPPYELEGDHLPLILQRVRKPLQPSMFGDWEES